MSARLRLVGINKAADQIDTSTSSGPRSIPGRPVYTAYVVVELDSDEDFEALSPVTGQVIWESS